MNPLLIRRRGMMAGKALPYDSRVEYLQSDGSAYINTGLKGGNDFYIKISAIEYFNSGSLGHWLFGARTANNNHQFGVLINSSSPYRVMLAYNSSYTNTAVYTSFPNTSVVEVGNGTIKINNSNYTYTQTTFQTQYDVILFGLNNAGGMVVRGSKIGDTYIKKGTIEIDWIPVRVGTVGYYYDQINGTLHGNDGGGAFIVGPDIV